MLRLFVAVEIEDATSWRRIIEFRDAIASCGIGGGVKPVEDENIHLTLRFIGEVPDSYLPRIVDCLRVVERFEAFSMNLGGVGAFPSIARPRVIWVGVRSGGERLREIRNSFEGCLRSIVSAEREEFVPHITVVRIKGGYRSDCLAALMRRYELEEFGVSPVTQVKLKRSQLTPKGPVYTDLATFRLLRG